MPMLADTLQAWPSTSSGGRVGGRQRLAGDGPQVGRTLHVAHQDRELVARHLRV
jgi:hypothetical protein